MTCYPRGALIGALARAGSPRGLSTLIKKLKAPLKKVKASAKVTGLAVGSLEAELTEDPKVTGPVLSDSLRSFDRPDRKLLLVLDEAQVLASPAHSDLTHSLRAGLDIRKQTIKVVFAGSSESSLRRMFGHAPWRDQTWTQTRTWDIRSGPDRLVLAVFRRIAGIDDLSRAGRQELALWPDRLCQAPVQGS